MNRLVSEQRSQILKMMAEGISLRGISRITGISRNTVFKLLADAGEPSRIIRTGRLRISPASRSRSMRFGRFAMPKKKRPTAKAAPDQVGDLSTWTAMRRFTRLTNAFLRKYKQIGGIDVGVLGLLSGLIGAILIAIAQSGLFSVIHLWLISLDFTIETMLAPPSAPIT